MREQKKVFCELDPNSGETLTRASNTPYSRPIRQQAVGSGRRPFWLPASNYYVLSAAVSIAFFFVVWGILHDEGDETPWISAGVGASILLAGAVILREVILRRARNRYFRLERRFDENFAGIRPQHISPHRRNKLTLEQNAAIIRDIKHRSDAAKVLNRFSAGHREVFELCGEYIARNEDELKTVGAGSPRFSALLKGRSAVSRLHRFHLLRWAEIEAKTLSNEARNQTNISARVKAAKNALEVVEFALESCPAEESLLESKELLRELVVSVKVSHLVEKAERAAFKHDFREAIGLYRDALFYLGRDDVHTAEREQAAGRVKSEIERLRLLESG